MKKKRTWALVVDTRRAKIFELVGKEDIPKELFEILNPAAHLKEQDLVSDRPGRVMQDPFKRRNSLPPHHKKTEQVISKFIDEVLTELVKLKRKGKFESLVLFAEPRLLGKLRSSLKGQQDISIVKEVRRDLLNTPAGCLAGQVQKYIYPPKSVARAGRLG